MGTVLSISPASKKGTIMDSGAAAGTGVISKNDKNSKKPSVLVSALTWKKLVTNSAKKKSAKKVSPNPPLPIEPAASQVALLNHENVKKSHQNEERKPKAPIPVPVPTVPTQTLQPAPTQNGKISLTQTQPNSVGLSLVSPRRVIIQASTGELLRSLGDFVCRRCYKLKDLTCADVILWFRNVDRTLLIQGWQDQGFITPANLVFVYLLCQDTIPNDIDNSNELQGTFLTCLYLAYSYMGNEISYPLKPFMIEANKDVFWERSLSIIESMSGKMLMLNSDPQFFTEVFQDLKNQRDPSESSLDR